MKRRLLGLALLAAAVWATTSEASAFGGRKKKNDCDAPCGPTMTAGYGSGYGHGAPCGYTVSYVDQKVTAYKTEWESKDVKVTVNEWVSVKEDFKYWVNEPTTTKQKVKVKEMAYKDEPHKYWVNEWVTTKEKVKVCEHKAITKDVEYTTYDLKPTVTKQKRTVCEWITVPVVVTCTIPAPVYYAPAPSGDSGRGGLFSRLCGKKKRNDCPPPCPAPCPTPCDAPCDQVVTKTVMQRQMVTREVDVDVTTYERIPKKGMHKVTTYEQVWTDKEVDVRKCVPTEKTGMHKVCYWVDVEKDMDVTTWKQVEKPGSRMVMKCVPTEKTVKQQFAKSVPYETTVKVPVYTPNPAPAPMPTPAPCDTPCYSPCATPCAPAMSAGCGSASSGRGGLFKRCK